MAVYIGRNPQYGIFAKQAITGDNTETIFTLDYDVPSQNALLVIKNGSIQNPGVNYTAVGTTLTFAVAPLSSDNIYVIFLGTSIVQPTLAPGFTTLVDYFTGNGSQTTYTLSEIPATEASILVVVDGVIQRLTTNWTLSGNELTFTGAPDNQSEIEVIFLTKARIASDIPPNGSVGTTQLSTSIRQSVFAAQEKTSSFTAETGYCYMVNTIGSAITATLPSGPQFGDVIRFIDAAGTFNANNLTLNRNGQRIQGLTENMVVSNNGAGFSLMFYNATYGWRLMEN
jgi:hypothetical protein